MALLNMTEAMHNPIFEDVDKYFTPYKFGRSVLAGSGKSGTFDSMAVDCPFVFYHQNQFHMLYVGFDGVGYQSKNPDKIKSLKHSPKCIKFGKYTTLK